MTIARELDDKEGIAGLLNSLGEMARLQNDYERARALYNESLALRRELGTRFGMAMMLHNLGYVALHRGDGRQAAAFFEESMALYRELNARKGIAECMAGLAGVARVEAQPERAARLFGATEVLQEATGTHLIAADKAEYDRNVALVRSQLDEATFAAVWAEGREMAADASVFSSSGYLNDRCFHLPACRCHVCRAPWRRSPGGNECHLSSGAFFHCYCFRNRCRGDITYLAESGSR